MATEKMNDGEKETGEGSSGNLSSTGGAVVKHVFLKRCKKKVQTIEAITPRRRSGRIANVMFGMRGKLQVGSTHIDLDDEQTTECGVSDEPEVGADTRNKKVKNTKGDVHTDGDIGDKTDGNKQCVHEKSASGDDNNATPSNVNTGDEEDNDSEQANGDQEGTEEEEEGSDEEGEGSDEEVEGTDDGEETEGGESGDYVESEHEDDEDVSDDNVDDVNDEGGSGNKKSAVVVRKSAVKSNLKTGQRKDKGKQSMQQLRGGVDVEKTRKGKWKRKKLVDIKAPYASLKSRSTPHVLMKAIEGMNAVQRAEVERMGFGSVLELDIWELPSRLGLWVVSNFDARSSSLKLPDNTKMHINAEDVNTVMGWPIGGQRIHCNKRNKDKALIKEWRGMFGTLGIKIRPNDVVEKMLSCTDGGEWFVRHFVTLIVSVLVDSTSHGYVNALVMDHLRDVHRVPKMNWCQYVLDKLIENKLKWGKKENQFFLLVFYVDRVSDLSRTVPRTFPAVLGWSGKELRKRENLEVIEGGFGLGHDDGRLSHEKRIEGREFVAEKRRKDAAGTQDNVSEQLIVEDSEEVLVRKIADKSKILSSTVIDLLTMVQDAPKSMTKNSMFRKIRNVCHKVIGINGEKKDVIEQEVGNVETDILEDSDFWSSPEVLAALQEAEKAAEARKKYEEFLNYVPSFSLGMTQVLQEEGGGVTPHENAADDAMNNEGTGLVTPMGCNVGVFSSDGGDSLNVTQHVPCDIPTMDVATYGDGNVGCEKGMEVDTNKEAGLNESEIRPESGKAQIPTDLNIEMENEEEHRIVEEDGRKKRKSSEVVQEVIAERARRKPKTAMTLKSPYLTRVIDPKENVNMFEKSLWKWIMRKEEDDRDVTVFNAFNIMVERWELMTLAAEQHISLLIFPL